MAASRALSVRRADDLLRILGIVILTGFVVATTVGFLVRIGYTSTIAVGGMFVAFLVFPAVRWLNGWLPLWAALTVVYAGVTVALAIAAWFLVPGFVEQLQAFVASIPHLENLARHALADPRNPLLRRIPAALRLRLEQVPALIGGYVQLNTASLSGQLLGILQSLVGFGALFLAIPVVSIYMLAEGALIKRFFLGLLPAQSRERALELLAELEQVIGGFIRGQLVVAAVVGSLVTILLVALHVPYAIVIGVFAGLFDVVPYIGAVAGYLPAAAIALVVNGPYDVLFVTLGFITINQLEGQLISPRIVSGSVGITPLAVIFALLVGGELFGLPGLVVAVPVAGLARVLVQFVRPPQPVPASVVAAGLSPTPWRRAPRAAATAGERSKPR